MPDNYKSLEGKQVAVSWSDNREEIKTVDRVNGKFVLFAGEKDWVSMHRIDGMEIVDAKNTDGVSLTMIEHPGSIPTPDLDENSLEEIEVEIEQEQELLASYGVGMCNGEVAFNYLESCTEKEKPKRLSRPYKKPKAYQRYSEGGIWYVHHGNGAGFNVKGQGGTLEEAYFDWKGKHTEKQGQRK